jgi:hypothetical protein
MSQPELSPGPGPGQSYDSSKHPAALLLSCVPLLLHAAAWRCRCQLPRGAPGWGRCSRTWAASTWSSTCCRSSSAEHSQAAHEAGVRLLKSVARTMGSAGVGIHVRGVRISKPEPLRGSYITCICACAASLRQCATYAGHGAHAHAVLIGSVGQLGLGELQAGGPAVVHNVVHLAGDLVVAQGGQVAEGLEHPERNKRRSDAGVSWGLLLRAACLKTLSTHLLLSGRHTIILRAATGAGFTAALLEARRRPADCFAIAAMVMTGAAWGLQRARRAAKVLWPRALGTSARKQHSGRDKAGRLRQAQTSCRVVQGLGPGMSCCGLHMQLWHALVCAGHAMPGIGSCCI